MRVDRAIVRCLVGVGLVLTLTGCCGWNPCLDACPACPTPSADVEAVCDGCWR